MWALSLSLATSSAQELETQDSDAGYIDNAIVMNRIRLRADAAYDNPFPDRAEFFYPTCGCFPSAIGPPLPESSVDYQELELDLELAVTRRLSGFVEVPFRFIDPVANANEAGLSDVRAGFKYALLAGPDSWLTFQTRVFAPTGDGRKGLGTEHPSLEPALLFQRNCNRLSFFGELRYWMPIDPNQEVFPLAVELGGPGGALRDYGGPVVRYGLGASYEVLRSNYACRPWWASVVTEFVGWTILDGLKERTLTPFEPILNPDGSLNLNFVEDYASARNDTIVNLKIGVRFNTTRDTLYLGYGRALTRDVWYEDIMRAEYMIRF
jgi:hypothetical protein